MLSQRKCKIRKTRFKLLKPPEERTEQLQNVHLRNSGVGGAVRLKCFLIRFNNFCKINKFMKNIATIRFIPTLDLVK